MTEETKYFRTQLSQTDNKLNLLKESMEEMDEFKDDVHEEELLERIEELMDMITEVQEAQGWI